MVKTRTILASAIIFIGSAASAVEPEPIEAGPFNVIPTITVDARDTDNMFLNADNEVHSKLYIVSPRLQAIAENNGNSLSLVGQVDEANYSATDEDDYTDWRVSSDVHLQMNVRNALDLNAGFFRTRETRGTGFSQGGFLPSTPDRYEETTYGISYQLGTRESLGRLVFGADSYDKAYINNRITTQFRDREDFDWSGAFYLNLSPRTDIFVEYIASDIDYGTDPTAVAGLADSLDSEEQYLYVGVSWEASAATTGSLKVGQGEKEFDDIDRQVADTSVWEANILWEPLSYSVFNFTASNSFDEATGVGDALETRRYSVNWQHSWSESLRSSLNWYTSDDEYTGSTRKDDIDAASFRLDYAVQRWFDVYVSISRDERSSNFANFNYDQTVAALGFTASL